MAKIWQSFHFAPVYTVRVSIFMLGWVKAYQSIKHVDVCRIHRETNVTSWHGIRQTHCDNDAHNVAWICTLAVTLSTYLHSKVKSTYDHERVAFLTMWIHHTKFMTIFKQASIYTHTHTHNANTQNRKVNHASPMFQGYGPARYKKDKLDIVIPKEHGPSKV